MPLFDVRCNECHWTAEDQWESGTPTPCAACGAPTVHVWTPRVTRSRAFVDEWPNGMTFDNGFPHPRTFYSRSSYHKALAENGFEVRGDGEEHHTWMSPETLKKAAELVTRVTSCASNTPKVEPSEKVDMPVREFARLVRAADEANR
jgi:hypothetical protein